VGCSSSLDVEISTDGTTITAIPIGGTLPYEYLWSTGESQQTIAITADDTYSVTVTDFGGCTAIDSVTIVCNSLAVTLDADDATLTVNITGGTTPYTYHWFNGDVVETEEASYSAGVLCNRTYSITVSDSQGCYGFDLTTVDFFPPCDSLEVSIEADTTNTVLTANASGCSGPYFYQWSTGETSKFIEVFIEGTYQVTVTDQEDCTTTNSIIVNSLNECDNLEVEIETDDTGQVLIANVTGGIAPYIYQWSTGELSESITITSGGTYEVIVTDNQGCVVITSITIDAIDCSNSPFHVVMSISNNSAFVIPVDGLPPYSYQWSTGETEQQIVTTENGIYDVTVTDAVGCTAIGSANIVCNGFAASIDADEATLTLNIIGGISPYTYYWFTEILETEEISNSIDVLCNGTYSVTVNDSQGCLGIDLTTVDFFPPCDSFQVSIETDATGMVLTADIDACPTGPYSYLWSTGETSKFIEVLTEGTYEVTVTDQEGCTAIATFVEGDSCNEFGIIEFEQTIDTLSVDVLGGMPPYTYLWSTGETTQEISNIISGNTYSVVVTDSQGCSIAGSYTVP